MSQILLIHGFGINIASPFQSPLGETKGFDCFQDQIANQTAQTFEWSIATKYTFLQSMNPSCYLKTYREEQKKAESYAIHEQLNEMIIKEQPSTIVCHSMGAYLLLNYLEHFESTNSVKDIIFTQADISTNRNLHKLRIYDQLKRNKIKITNYYCQWDPALLSSSIYNSSLRAGLKGINEDIVCNKFFPLNKHLSAHISPLMDEDFARKCLLH